MALAMQPVNSSFRDPGNQVFADDQHIYRLIRRTAVPHYHALMQSGLYDKLVSKKLLVPHEDVTAARANLCEDAGDIVIKPQKIPLISYPCEWSFSALKEAALNTLSIQKLCLDHGLTLQDATGFNMQYLDGHWVMLDTGSFHKMPVFAPWGAYRQFCEHFLAPLLLMTYADGRLLSLLGRYQNGIPLDLAARLLPWRARCRPAIYMHIVMHSRFALRDFSTSASAVQEKPLSKASAYGLLDQLRGLISGLQIEKKQTAWTDYESNHTYRPAEFSDKEDFIRKALAQMDSAKPLSVWDLGANTGHFSRLMAHALPTGSAVTAFEYDLMTVERGTAASRACPKNKPLHLWLDLFNPTPSSGWAEREWGGLIERGPADIVLALALVHHLCLAGNIPLPQIADFMARIGKYMIIEFVPKDDPQSLRLLKSKKDIYTGYNQDDFEKEMAVSFSLIDRKTVSSTGRTLYFMKRHD